MPQNLMPLLTVPHEAFGVAATVTPVGDSPVDTTVIRIRQATSPAIGTLSLGPDTEVPLRAVLSIPRATVPTLPEGSLVAGDFGDGMRTYRVDRIDDQYPDEWRVVVS